MSNIAVSIDKETKAALSAVAIKSMAPVKSIEDVLCVMIRCHCNTVSGLGFSYADEKMPPIGAPNVH